MNDKLPVAPAGEDSAQKVPAGERRDEKPTTGERRTDPKTRGPSPDAEGGQPVDEMDLDGDGARRV